MENIDKHIIVIGSGNAECIIKLCHEFKHDRKYVVKYHDLLGGSGLNYTFRLLKAGFSVFPILSMGKDTSGKSIRKDLLGNTEKTNASEEINRYIGSHTFLAKNMSTPRTTIIADKNGRTIFTEKIDNIQHFDEHLKNCLNYFKSHIEGKCKAVIIGHIQSDNPEINKSNAGDATKLILDLFHDKCFIFANFGDSQIKPGIEFWEEYLQKVSVFQLNLIEMKKFFSCLQPDMPLSQMIEWFRLREINVIITSDKFGAIGSFQDGEEGLIFAPSLKLKEFTDSTGAGDAFMAGLVSKLYKAHELTFQGYHDAIAEARIWAAYACTTLGAASDCPTRNQLKEFKENNLMGEDNRIEIVSVRNADETLNSFDML